MVPGAAGVYGGYAVHTFESEFEKLAGLRQLVKAGAITRAWPVQGVARA